MSFFKPQISFPLNFTSPFSVMIHNSSEIFLMKYMFWRKRALQCIIFQTFECSDESSTNSSCHSWNHHARVYSNFSPLFSVMKDNSSVFFRSNLIYTLDKNWQWKWNFWTFAWTLYYFDKKTHQSAKFQTFDFTKFVPW